MILGIIGGVILLIIILIGVGFSIQDKNRRRKCENWKVNDKLVLNISSRYHKILEEKQKEYAILRGWDLEQLYISCGDGMIYQVNWSELDYNKSSIWRENYENAKKFMGCDPAFSESVGESSESTGKTYSGKPIDLMSEIECEVYLKKALEKEDYDTAELIKKRMEKFR